MGAVSNPIRLSEALSELIAVKGLAQIKGFEQLQAIWNETSGHKIASETKVLKFRRGVLLVGVSSAPLLSELVGFHKTSLLNSLQKNHLGLEIYDLKFRLVSSIAGQRHKDS